MIPRWCAWCTASHTLMKRRSFASIVARENRTSRGTSRRGGGGGRGSMNSTVLDPSVPRAAWDVCGAREPGSQRSSGTPSMYSIAKACSPVRSSTAS